MLLQIMNNYLKVLKKSTQLKILNIETIETVFIERNQVKQSLLRWYVKMESWKCNFHLAQHQ